MSELENQEAANWDHHCLVCGKTVDQGGGMAHIKAGDRMIALCCPLCIETFNKNPMHYLQMRQIRDWDRKLRRPEKNS